MPAWPLWRLGHRARERTEYQPKPVPLADVGSLFWLDAATIGTPEEIQNLPRTLPALDGPPAEAGRGVAGPPRRADG